MIYLTEWYMIYIMKKSTKMNWINGIEIVVVILKKNSINVNNYSLSKGCAFGVTMFLAGFA
jgi:hypothetical protein